MFDVFEDDLDTKNKKPASDEAKKS